LHKDLFSNQRLVSYVYNLHHY